MSTKPEFEELDFEDAANDACDYFQLVKPGRPFKLVDEEGHVFCYIVHPHDMDEHIEWKEEVNK